MKVSVQAHLNVTPDYKALYEAVQSHIDKRDDRIHQLEIELQNARDENAGLKVSAAPGPKSTGLS